MFTIDDLSSHRDRRALRFRWVALTFAFGLIAAGCGGDATTDETTATTEAAAPTETTTTVAAETTTTAPADTTTTASSEPTTVRLAFVPATTGLLVNVAQEQGFFADNDLEVELIPTANVSEIIPTLGQQTDISLGTATDLIRAADSGLDIVQILGNTIGTEDNPFVRLIVGPDSGIEDVTDLAGRRVSSPTLSGVIHVATLYWAQQEGVDPASIEGVQVPPANTVEQFEAGQVDAAEALEPFASALIAQGNVSIGDPFASIGLPLATNFWIANGDWAQDNRQVVDAFRQSLDQAQAFVDSNEEEARAILQGYTGMPDPVAAGVALPTFDLEIRTDDLARWVEVLVSLGEFEGEIDVTELVLSD
ncbi:MAG: ABC transporter substrate-binding protein [Acidimicrobiia bacterium]